MSSSQFNKISKLLSITNKVSSTNKTNLFSQTPLIQKYEIPLNNYFKSTINNSISNGYMLNDFTNITINNNNLHIPNLKLHNDGYLIHLIPDNLLNNEIKQKIQNILKDLDIKYCFQYKINVVCVNDDTFNKLNNDKFSIYNVNNIKENYKIVSYDLNIIKMKNTNKRKRTDIYDNQPISKKRTLDNNWIAASRLRNYVLNDPLIDWLRMYETKNKSSQHIQSQNSDNIFLNLILNNGIKYEERIVQELMSVYTYNFVKICDSLESRNIDMLDKTLDTMKEGIYLIHQAVLHNPTNKTFGCVDLLCRSDKINEIFNGEYLTKEESTTGCKFNSNYHYVVVDIKWHKLQFTVKNNNIYNEGSTPPFKAQLLIYDQALKHMQSYSNNKAFVLGKNRNKDDNYILGTIDYDGFDEKYRKIVKDGLNYYRDFLKNGSKWEISPKPSNKYLYPNMKNQLDTGYRKRKEEIATKINDITNIYYCGIPKRDKAFDKNITSWNDERLTPDILGFNKQTKIYDRVKNILEVNRNKNIYTLPKVIKNKIGEWNTSNKYMDIFIDFEFFNSMFSSLETDKHNEKFDDFLFMIGMGWIENDNWVFKTLVTKKVSLDEEHKICTQMFKYIDDISKKFGKPVRLVHYNFTEKNMIEKKAIQHKLKFVKFNYLDLYKVLTEDAFAVKDSYNYKLKSIVKALNKHKKINCDWESETCDGLSAMVNAFNIYKQHIDIHKSSTFNDIIKYNEIDCKALYELLTYLNKNHK
jgi:hypothetical protein